ncbi:MAG: ABC1 kinase family protein [Thermodesulfobacteriota bacterium]
MLQELYQEIPSAVSLGINGFKRIRQTAGALVKTGLDYVLQDRPPSPVLLRRAFERLGATYIKLGQFIASSPSLFPENYVKEFQRCLDRTEPVPFAQIKKILKKELGNRYMEDIFSFISSTPLASASIAQVHAARLVSGENAVIKIQRPGVRETLTTDLNFLFFAANLLEFLVPGLKHASLSGILAEIRRTVMEECDFKKEAENIQIFADYLKDTGNTAVVTPRIFSHAATKRVLTLERLDGIPVTDRKQLLESTDRPHAILNAAFSTWLDSVTACRLFHADLHAGNLLVLADGRVGFIDFGIVGHISRRTREGVSSLLTSMITGDIPLMARAMAAIGMTKKKVDTVRLADDLKALYQSTDISEDWDPVREPGTLPAPEDFLLEIVRIGQEHGIRFPREFTLLIKQFLYFDSYRDILFDMDIFAEKLMEKLDKLDADEYRLTTAYSPVKCPMSEMEP